MTTFEELGINNLLLKGIEAMGFNSPMPVQEKVIPKILNQKNDLIVLAQTGTGKTAAFGLPTLQNINTNHKKPQVLILSPTRELCLQIAGDLENYTKFIPSIQIAAIYGGSSIENQIKLLKSGVQVIVATPGRMMDMIKRKAVSLETVDYFILDEADEMLDMGFADELNFIAEKTPTSRTTLLFSATMPYEVEKIAQNYMQKPETISIGERNTAIQNVEHNYYIAKSDDRYLVLKRIADFYPNMYGIVFCRTRTETQEIADFLIRDGYNAASLHGDLSQAQRDQVMKNFKLKYTSLLVATDVAARGIDVDDLTHVINYKLPDDSDVYIHRSGRTGRIGKKGICVSIATQRDKKKIAEIEKNISRKLVQKQIPTAMEVCNKQIFHLVNKMESIEIIEDEIESFLPTIYKKLSWMTSQELIKRFVSVEFNRFLDYYRNAPDLNSSKKTTDNDEDYDYTRVFLNVGRKDSLQPAKLLGLIKDYTNKSIKVGRIDIAPSFSFIDIDSKDVNLFMKNFSGKTLNNRKIVVDLADNPKKPGRRRSEKKTKKTEKSSKKKKKM